MKIARILLLSSLLTLAATPAFAQDAAGGDKLQALIEELKTQLERGEKERLIDPWYLRDLRKTLRRYEYPWGKRLFSDDFSGRGPQPDPPWQVTAGEFLIDWRYGLRSVVERAAPQAQQSQQTQRSDKDQMKQLFGQLLNQAITGQQTQQQQQQPAVPQGPGFAAAIAPVAITNAFAIRIEITARQTGDPEPRFEFGPFQGEGATAGYRLAYTPGAPKGSASLELIGLSTRGTVSLIELYDRPLDLEDGKAHVIEWTRSRRGRMVVRVDGAEVIDVVDRRFRDDFNGFVLVNSGGDYALRSLVIDGTG
ncbi:MAG: hypothetical protein V3T80_03630 [Kiloniellales bacterium]